MFDEARTLEPPRNSSSIFAAARLAKETASEADAGGEEDECSAFGYLRGVRDKALALQLRYRTGNCDWFSYSLLASWRHNPSVGLLLKFTSDVVSLILIRGSNLDALINNSINLTDRGLQRHRVTWIREMDEDELRKAGQGEPTIDRFEVGEFESNVEAMDWLKNVAPVFVR